MNKLFRCGECDSCKEFYRLLKEGMAYKTSDLVCDKVPSRGDIVKVNGRVGYVDDRDRIITEFGIGKGGDDVVIVKKRKELTKSYDMGGVDPKTRSSILFVGEDGKIFFNRNDGWCVDGGIVTTGTVLFSSLTVSAMLRDPDFLWTVRASAFMDFDIAEDFDDAQTRAIHGLIHSTVNVMSVQGNITDIRASTERLGLLFERLDELQ